MFVRFLQRMLGLMAENNVMNSTGPMQPIEPDRAAKLRERFRNAAQLPLLAFVVVLSSLGSWLGIWTIFRVAEFLYDRFLRQSWLR